MNFTVAGKNLMLDALTGMTAALFTSADYANDEVSGGSYARKTVGFEAADTGNRNADVLPTFDVPANTTITHGAIYIGATRIAEGPLSSSESFTAAGQYQLTDADLTLQNVA